MITPRASQDVRPYGIERHQATMVDMAVRSGTTTTLRVDRPDGTVTEIIWHDLGHTVTTYLADDGALVRRYGVGRGRETMVGWDGRTVVVEDAAPPTVSEEPW